MRFIINHSYIVWYSYKGFSIQNSHVSKIALGESKIFSLILMLFGIKLTIQVHEVLKLVIELLPASPVEDNQLASEKESFLVNQPDLLQQFGRDMLPVMIQVISGIQFYSLCV